MAPIFKYGLFIFKYRPDIQIFEYISHYFYITLAFQISNCYSKDSIRISGLVLKESPKETVHTARTAIVSNIESDMTQMEKYAARFKMFKK